jgi:hypothetical protein
MDSNFFKASSKEAAFSAVGADLAALDTGGKCVERRVFA